MNRMTPLSTVTAWLAVTAFPFIAFCSRTTEVLETVRVDASSGAPRLLVDGKPSACRDRGGAIGMK